MKTIEDKTKCLICSKELINQCKIPAALQPKDTKARVVLRLVEAEEETTSILQKGCALSICKLLYMPSYPFVYFFQYAGYCDVCRTTVEEVGTIFQQLELLKDKISDMRTNIETELKQNYKLLLKRVKRSTINVPPIPPTTNSCGNESTNLKRKFTFSQVLKLVVDNIKLDAETTNDVKPDIQREYINETIETKSSEEIAKNCSEDKMLDLTKSPNEDTCSRSVQLNAKKLQQIVPTINLNKKVNPSKKEKSRLKHRQISKRKKKSVNDSDTDMSSDVGEAQTTVTKSKGTTRRSQRTEKSCNEGEFFKLIGLVPKNVLIGTDGPQNHEVRRGQDISLQLEVNALESGVQDKSAGDNAGLNYSNGEPNFKATADLMVTTTAEEKQENSVMSAESKTIGLIDVTEIKEDVSEVFQESENYSNDGSITAEYNASDDESIYDMEDSNDPEWLCLIEGSDPEISAVVPYRNGKLSGKKVSKNVGTVPAKLLKIPCDFGGNCNKTFLDEEAKNMHVRKVHKGEKLPYGCDQCIKRFASKKTLMSHQKKHSGLCSPSLICDKCGKIFCSQQSLKGHILLKHMEKFPLACEVCSKGFMTTLELDAHATIHKGETPFACDICDAVLTNSNDLKVHILQHDDNQIKCKVCNKIFASRKNLLDHQLRHKDINWVKCKICQKEFVSERQVKKHMVTHSSEKKFQCSVCGEAFKYSYYLLRHTRKEHTGETPFKCKICGKGFTESSQKRRHEEIHSGIKKYVCDICGKAFRTHHNHYQHQRTHVNDEAKLAKKNARAENARVLAEKAKNKQKTKRCQKVKDLVTEEPPILTQGPVMNITVDQSHYISDEITYPTTSDLTLSTPIVYFEVPSRTDEFGYPRFSLDHL